MLSQRSIWLRRSQASLWSLVLTGMLFGPSALGQEGPHDFDPQLQLNLKEAERDPFRVLGIKRTPKETASERATEAWLELQEQYDPKRHRRVSELRLIGEEVQRVIEAALDRIKSGEFETQARYRELASGTKVINTPEAELIVKILFVRKFEADFPNYRFRGKQPLELSMRELAKRYDAQADKAKDAADRQQAKAVEIAKQQAAQPVASPPVEPTPEAETSTPPPAAQNQPAERPTPAPEAESKTSAQLRLELESTFVRDTEKKIEEMRALRRYYRQGLVQSAHGYRRMQRQINATVVPSAIFEMRDYYMDGEFRPSEMTKAEYYGVLNLAMGKVFRNFDFSYGSGMLSKADVFALGEIAADLAARERYQESYHESNRSLFTDQFIETIENRLRLTVNPRHYGELLALKLRCQPNLNADSAQSFLESQLVSFRKSIFNSGGLRLLVTPFAKLRAIERFNEVILTELKTGQMPAERQIALVEAANSAAKAALSPRDLGVYYDHLAARLEKFAEGELANFASDMRSTAERQNRSAPPAGLCRTLLYRAYGQTSAAFANM